MPHEGWFEAGGTLPWDQVPVHCNSCSRLGLLREILPWAIIIIIVVKWLLVHHD